DRMGAIIHGNPKEYARTRTNMAFHTRPSLNIPHAQATEKYLSSNGLARMLHTWADILEQEGATDKVTGNIIDRKKALEVFERSKEFAQDLLQTGPARFR
ncbi:MAG: hypothetical protein KGJ06_09925, partial [Pseudomonadota bacterium]|nr:hypothetical protein [Pseudomonadota bacterium]